MFGFVLASVLLAGILIACSDSDSEPANPPGPSPTPSLGDTSPTPGTSEASPTRGAGASSPTPVSTEPVTVARLMEVGEQVFPLAPSGVYGVCGAGGNVEACPFTERLKSRLTEARATLCRCQNPSTTRTMSAEVADFGGVLYVVLYEGSQTYMLTVVNRDGRLLVDDQTCHGQGPETSIYETLAPC